MRLDRIVFATTNEGKLREAHEILGIPIQSVTLDVHEIQTLNPVECVEAKAEAALAKARTEKIDAVLVDDTTLFFEALNGLPGVFTDYFIKAIGVNGMLKLVNGHKNRKAIAQTSLCYYDGHQKITSIGKVFGTLPDKPLGENGFGWDSIFIPKGYDQTFSEMDPKIKNKISPRRLAFEDFKKKLKTAR